MNRRFHIALSILAVAAAAWIAPPAAGQTPATAPQKPVAAKAGKTNSPAATVKLTTPWGEPDLQGVWNDATSTPLQRPNGVIDKDTLSDEEAAQFQDKLAFDLTRDRRDGVGTVADVNRAYNEHWMDSRRLKITPDRRTSLIVDPPDGRIPPRVTLSPERQKVRAERGAAADRFNAGLPASYTDMSLPVQCIIRSDDPPYLPNIYNNDFQIYQSPGIVAVAPEMIHSARIIPLDGRPHLNKNLKQWLGDTRGHWEGKTLVVETTNFRSDPGVVYQGASADTFSITERFTRTGPLTLDYEFTVADPTTWTRPWTARIPWVKIDPEEQMYEYACHEDNYDMVHFLSGARAREKKAGGDIPLNQSNAAPRFGEP